MGFIMNGLEAEDYDRQYSDWELVKRILGYFKPHLWKMIAVGLVVFLSSLMELSLPIVVSMALGSAAIHAGDFRSRRCCGHSHRRRQHELGSEYGSAVALGGGGRRCHA